MALTDNAFYVDFGNGSSTGYYAITVRPQNTAVAAGVLRRQFTVPAVGSERVFICIIAGTTANTTDATWVLTRGALTTDGTATWQECTGQSSVNGDLTNTPNWTTVKAAGAVTLGQIIQRNSGASYQICSTAGTLGAGEPAGFSNTAGVTTADNTATWTSLGAVGNFTGWQAPHARIQNAHASSWAQAGNTVFVASEHAETQTTGIALGAAASIASSWVNTLCVAKTPVPPTGVTTGATVTSTTSAGITFSGGLFGYYYGIAFSGGSGANTQGVSIVHEGVILDNCTVACPSTTASSTKLNIFNTRTGYAKFFNTSFSFGNVGDNFAVQGDYFEWKGGAITGAIVPSTLFLAPSSFPANALIDGVDLSLVTGTIIGTSGNAQHYTLKNCKLNASVTISAVPTGLGNIRTDLVNCDNGTKNYRLERYIYTGTQTMETTIVRTGGATDGTTPVSWKIVTTANTQWAVPFNSILIAIWNNTVGSSVTATVYGIWGGGAVPNNDDIWIEIEYLNSSAAPQSSFITDTKANFLATSTPLSSDSSSWGGSTTPFKMSVAFTPQMIGLIYITVQAAKPSTTFYIDPKVVLS